MWTLSSLFYLHRLCREEELGKKVLNTSNSKTTRPSAPSKSMKPPCILKGRPASAMREWLYDLPTSLYHHLKVPSNSSSPIVNGFYCPTLKAGICWNTCLRDHNFGGPRAAESPSSNDCKSGKAKIKIVGFWGENYETYPYRVNINIR